MSVNPPAIPGGRGCHALNMCKEKRSFAHSGLRPAPLRNGEIDLEIRSIVPSEYEKTRNIQTVAFGSKNDPAAQPKSGSHRTYRAVFEQGKACACLESFPLRAFLGGRQVGMSGIGGVATLPEERHKGYIRSLFRYTLEESRGNGDGLSYLFPFSHLFYRRFGYESCMVKNRVSIPLSAFPPTVPGGRAALYEPGDDPADIRALYDRFAEGINLMTLRSEEKWSELLALDPYVTRQYLYVWHGASGAPLGYVRFAPQDEGSDKDLVASELIWASPEGLRGLLGFLGGFTAQYRRFVYRAPEFLNFRLMIGEPYAVESRAECTGMGRVVDAGRVLETLGAPADGDAVVFRVHDDFLEWNDGTFALYADGGRARVEPARRSPSVETDVRTLAQLVAGYVSAEDCLLAGTAEFTGDFARLSRLFPKRRVYIADEF